MTAALHVEREDMIETINHQARGGLRLERAAVDVEVALDANRLAGPRHRDARQLAQAELGRLFGPERLEPATRDVVHDRAQRELGLACGHVPEAAVEQALERAPLREPGEAARRGEGRPRRSRPLDAEVVLWPPRQREIGHLAR